MSEPIHTKASTIGGTMVILLVNISSADLMKTIVLAATGAIVSYLTSLVMKKVVSWWKTRKG